jgi:hypothetical protein
VIVAIISTFIWHSSFFVEEGQKVMIGDESNAMLQKHIAELEEANAWLDTSNAEMHLTISQSSEAITMLRRELDVELENYELLRLGNTP